MDNAELDNFQVFKSFIKKFIISNENLFKLIYYPYSSPLEKDMPENPYSIFDGDKIQDKDDIDNLHGVFLFRRKYDQVISSEIPVVLVTFTSAKVGNSDLLDDVFISIRILCKGTNIQELANGRDRSSSIANLIDNELKFARITDVGNVSRKSYTDIALNEENVGNLLLYTSRSLASDLLDNVNYLKKHYGVDSREYL